MGRLHFSSAPKYQKAEPVCEVQTFPKWADQAFDPEAEDLSGLMMVYEAFLDREGRPPLPDDADALSVSEISSGSSSSSATEDDTDLPTQQVSRDPQTPAYHLPPHVVTNVFDDFVRIEVPRSESDGRPLTVHQPRSPLRQSIAPDTDEGPEQPSLDHPVVVLRRGDDERLFNYFQSPERPPLPTRIGLERVAPPARRIPGHPRLFPRVDQRVPLSNPIGVDHGHVRPRSASVSDALASGTRVPERWLAAVDGTVVSNRILAQR